RPFPFHTGHYPEPVAGLSSSTAVPPLSQPTEVRSCSCGTAPPPVQAKRGLPGLLHCDLLSPRTHERGSARIACVALERIALEEGPSATDTDRLLGDRDDCALHGDMRRPGALDRLQRSIDYGLCDCSVVDLACGIECVLH